MFSYYLKFQNTAPGFIMVMLNVVNFTYTEYSIEFVWVYNALSVKQNKTI